MLRIVANQAVFERCKTRLTPLLGRTLLHHEKTYSSAASNDPDFLHKSILPTDHFQTSLPHLPIPKLEDTCTRYLKAQQPLLSNDQYNKTEKIVEGFKNNEGKILNEELIATDKKNKHTNYVSEAWFDMYLKDRRAICLNQNPFISFNDDPRPEYNDQLVRSTNFLVSSLRFMKTLRTNVLEPEVFHLNPAKSDNETFRRVMRFIPKPLAFYGAALLYQAYPLDMSQYYRLFASTRIPRPEKDELLSSPDSKHIVILRKGHFYVFDVLDANGSILPAEQIMAHLKYILNDKIKPPEFPLAVLTAQDRDTWTKLRQDIVDSGNADTLNKVDSGLFVMCLDDEELNDSGSLSRSFLHGNGMNRWFDKSFSLLVTANGKAAVNFEHSWGDGVAVLRYFNEVFTDTTTHPRVHPDTQPASTDSKAAVKRLEFHLSDTAKQGILDSLADFSKTISGLDMDFVKYEARAKKDIKQYKLSPDSFMQLSFQMAFYRQYQKTVATYESCSTAAFKHGRTETIRPATMMTKKACQMFDKSSGVLPSVSELQECVRECSKVHSRLTKEAAMGQGFDRHLFGLKNLATKKGGELPEIFRDPAYAMINHNILSTSTLSSPAVLLGGFAPVVQDGYGIGYGIDDSYLGCIITSYPPHRNVNEFVRCIEESLTDLVNVMEGKPLK